MGTIDKEIQRIAFHHLMGQEVNSELQDLKNEKGKEEVKFAIIRNGLSNILLEKYFEGLKQSGLEKGSEIDE